ncbi:hypothetical protein [Salinigranum sp.]|uniref:hypothetical protein n=1 Tax=Salinigranum sp. TaxID=1966351 RepID=UPI00356661CD
MSSNATSTDATGADESRPSREVAYRLFAAEFDDASFSYSESDEERAPNYVVTPTGARVNRLFAVGVLTEVEPVNDDVLRGRIVDPTGAFVSYAGQYQPDEMAFLDRASPPAFVALSGKARTFQPEDSDRVFTSVRPESMSRVDADTRDRWTVSTAEATLERVGVMAAALQSGLRGGELGEALRAAGVDEPLSKGIPLAIDHYGTTPDYLAALRRLALDALEVVANERDSVRALDREPGAGDGNADLAALAADIELAASATAGTAATDDGTTTPDPTSDPEREPGATSADAGDAKATESAAGTAASAEAAGDTDAESIPEFDDAGGADPDTSTSSADSTPEPSADADTAEATSTETTSATSGEAESTAETDARGTAETTTSTEPTDATPSADDELGDFESDAGTTATTDAGSELGDFDADETASSPTSEAETVERSVGADADADNDVTAADGVEADLDEEGMYELDPEERAQIEEEFGTEFSTGSEVAPAGEADIDVPSVDELDEELGEDRADSESETAEPASDESPNEPATDSAPAAERAERAESTGTDDEGAVDESAAAEDVDIEAAAVDAMDALDDGDGASREAVVARVVDEYGVDPGAVEDAIQSALMSGQCYEPTEDSLKAI